jgi:hypothetical protein
MNINDITCSAYKVNKSFEALTLIQVLEATEMDNESITNVGLFQFARGIRALSLSEDRKFTSNQLTEMFDQWFNLNEEYLLGHYGYEDLLFDFYDKLEKVKIPLGHDFVKAAWHAVFLHPYPPEAAQFQQEELKQLTALCWQLQKASSEDVFFLSCRHVQKLFGLNHANVGARWLRGLVRFGVLEEIEKGGPHTNKATRYRYVAIRH